MKKVLLMLVAGAFMSASIMSCGDCGTCKFGGIAISSKVCKKDGEAAYNETKAECNALPGYTWSKSN